MRRDADPSYRCGDLCTYWGWNCTCGQTILRHDSHQFCCLPQGHNCTHSGIDSDDDARKPVCSTGLAVNKTIDFRPYATYYHNNTDLAGNPSCYPDNSQCLYEYDMYWCGDRCLSKNSPCFCGNETFGYFSRRPCNGACPDPNQYIQKDDAGNLSCEYNCSSSSYKCGNLCAYNDLKARWCCE